MKIEEIFLIGHDTRRSVDGGIKGSFTSLNNLVRDLVIYEYFYVEHTKHSHALAEPIYKIIDNKELILNKMKNIDFDALELKHEEIDDGECYVIKTISGRKITILEKKLTNEEKEKLDDLLENNEYIGDTSRKYIDQLPFLNYTKVDLNKKIDNLEIIKGYITNKDKQFLKLIDEECVCFLEDGRKLLNRSQIKKYIYSIIGILGIKLRYSVSANFYGFINNDKPDIMLRVHYYTTQNDRGKYILMDFEINSEGRIKTIKLKNNDLTIGKELNDVAIKYVRTKEYDDFNDDIANEVKGSNITWSEFVKKNFSSSGTKTTLADIRLKPSEDENDKENYENLKNEYKFEISRPFEEDFGYSIDNPIEVTSVSDEYFYLNNLITDTKAKITYVRVGSVKGKMSNLMDKFDISLNNKYICSLYLYPYSKRYCNCAPKGFFYIEQIDWGDGIPQYDEYDLFNEFEIHDFGIDVVLGFSRKNGYKIVSFNNRLDVYPSFVMDKDGERYFVLVRTTGAPNDPVLKEEEKRNLVIAAKRFNAIPLFAPVSIGAADGERFEKEIFLRGDGYYAKFVDFEEVTYDVRDINFDLLRETELLNHIWGGFLNIISKSPRDLDLYAILRNTNLFKESENVIGIEFEKITNGDRDILEIAHNKKIISMFLLQFYNPPIQVILKYPNEEIEKYDNYELFEPKENEQIQENEVDNKCEDVISKKEDKYCVNCGKKIQEDWKFCKYCGEKI